MYFLEKQACEGAGGVVCASFPKVGRAIPDKFFQTSSDGVASGLVSYIFWGHLCHIGVAPLPMLLAGSPYISV